MILRLLGALVLLGLLLGGVFGWKAYQQQLATEAGAGGGMPPTPIAAATVRSENWRGQLKAVGSLVASRGIFVTNEVAGQVSELLFSSGSTVAMDELLLQLDDSVDQAELSGLIAERRLAEIQFQRLQKLIKDRSVSRSDYDEAKARLDRAAAAVAAARALIEKKAIKAPFAGQLGIRKVEVGEFLTPGSRIVSLQSLDSVYADFSLPERHVGALRVGQTVSVRVRAWPDETFSGRVTAISPGIDVDTRSLRLRATLPNPDGRLHAGMFAEVETLLALRRGVVTVPQTAISFNPYGSFVFVIAGDDGDLSVQSRKVTTGTVRDERVEIIAGLTAGERVVSAGQIKLRNGQAVLIDDTDTLSDLDDGTAATATPQ